MNIDEFRDLKFSCELGFTRLSRSESAEKVAEFFGTESVTLDGDTYGVQDNSGRTWRLERDDSIKPEKLDSEGNRVLASEKFQCHIKSPLLNYNEIPILQELVTNLLANGANINSSCVFRCSIKANFALKHIRYLINMIFEHQSLLERALQTQVKRRTKCKPIPDKVIEALNMHKPCNLRDFALIWYADDYGTASDRVINLTNVLNGKQEIQFQLFNGVLDPESIKSIIQFTFLVTLKALNQNRATFKETLSNQLCDKERMYNWLLDLGTKPGDEFIDMRIYLLQYLPSKTDWEEYCEDVDSSPEEEEACKPPQGPFPNGDVPDSVFSEVSEAEWKKYCNSSD